MKQCDSALGCRKTTNGRINVLLLGSGGRESAMAWKLSQSQLLGRLYIAPGNGGIDAYGECVALSPMDFAGIGEFACEHDVQLVIVGNEDPLVGGIYDYFTIHHPGIRVLGPSRAAAQLEGSKDFAKGFMARHGVPTAAYRTFGIEEEDRACDFLTTLAPPYVLKADGLAAGKGVLIINDLAEAQASLRKMLGGMFGDSSRRVVIEEFLDGIECSVFVLTDGAGDYRILPVAKDYKRRGEGDTGLNTGGMGAVSPVVFADTEFMAKVEERIVRPTVEGLLAEELTYRGFIFFGLIKVGDEPKVIEYNVRMGDPETEVVMRRLHGDLVELTMAAAEGNLGDVKCEDEAFAAATVIAVSGGYPEAYGKGYEITGDLSPENALLFHAGTRRDEHGRLVTSGGRVIAVTAVGEDLPEALARSYEALSHIAFEGMDYRRDIGRDVLSMAHE